VTGAGPGRHQLALAVLLPAAAAAVLTMLALAPGPRSAPFRVARGSASRLARMADAPSLRPIVLKGGGATLGVGPAGSLGSGPRPAPPATMAIPSLHVDAPIQPVGTTPAGDLEVPPIGRAGWVDAGPRPGEPGRTVIVGHIDGLTRPGVFQHVPEIRSGSEIDIRDADGRRHRFAVVGKLQVAKSAFPRSAVYGPSQRSVLVLVTCGGVYERGVGYSDNVIVYARALEAV
jgi:hypothetical protein